MTTTYNEFQNDPLRPEPRPFRIFELRGEPGELMVVTVSSPCSREEYRNSVSIIDGFLDCDAPDGSVERWHAGQVDLELPAYKMPGRYRLRPGPEGVEFFCASICCPALYGHMKFRRRLILPSEREAQFPAEQMIVLVRGSVEIDGQTTRAPLVIRPRAQPMSLRFDGCKGVVLWLE